MTDETLYNVPFTQYLRPHGKRTPTHIQRPKGVADKAQKLIEAGYELAVEELMDGQVSLTVEKDDEEGELIPLSHEICANGKDIPPTVDKLINGAFERLNDT